MCPPLDDADKKFIRDLIGETLKPETIGAAVRAHIDGLKLVDVVKAEVKEATKDLKPPDDKGGDKGDKTKGGDDAAAQRIAALEKKVQEEQEARRTAEQRARTDRLHSEARAALGKAPEIETRVDPALLGGIRVRVGSKLFDASLRSKLDSLKFALKRA